MDGLHCIGVLHIGELALIQFKIVLKVGRWLAGQIRAEVDMANRLVVSVMLMAFIAGPAGSNPPCCCYTPQQLIRMDECQLQEIFRNGQMTQTPSGPVKGWAIIKPGRITTVPRTYMTKLLWQGKEFSCDGTSMINRVMGMKAVRADAFPDNSWFDGQPALIFDYYCSSKLFSDARDEVREICPGLYLGVTYLRKKCGPELVAYFVLESKDKCCR